MTGSIAEEDADCTDPPPPSRDSLATALNTSFNTPAGTVATSQANSPSTARAAIGVGDGARLSMSLNALDTPRGSLADSDLHAQLSATARARMWAAATPGSFSSDGTIRALSAEPAVTPCGEDGCDTATGGRPSICLNPHDAPNVSPGSATSRASQAWTVDADAALLEPLGGVGQLLAGATVPLPGVTQGHGGAHAPSGLHAPGESHSHSGRAQHGRPAQMHASLTVAGAAHEATTGPAAQPGTDGRMVSIATSQEEQSDV